MKNLRKILEGVLKNLENDFENELQNCVDIELHTDLDGNLIGYKIILTYGGPTIILENQFLRIYYNDKSDYIEIPDDLFNQIWEYLEEIKGF